MRAAMRIRGHRVQNTKQDGKIKFNRRGTVEIMCIFTQFEISNCSFVSDIKVSHSCCMEHKSNIFRQAYTNCPTSFHTRFYDIVQYILFSSCQMAFSDYLDWGFSVFFPQLYGKCHGIPRKDGARSALFLIRELCCSMYCLCRLCCSMNCLCVNVYCTTSSGCQPNFS